MCYFFFYVILYVNILDGLMIDILMSGDVFQCGNGWWVDIEDLNYVEREKYCFFWYRRVIQLGN